MFPHRFKLFGVFEQLNMNIPFHFSIYPHLSTHNSYLRFQIYTYFLVTRFSKILKYLYLSSLYVEWFGLY